MKREKLFKTLLDENFIETKDKELILFGLQQARYLLTNVLIVMLIGLFFRELISSICFLIAFSILRTYAGGYHCVTIKKCYVISIAIMFTVIWSFQSDVWNRINSLYTIIASGAVIFVIAPVDTKNHRLDIKERQIFRKKTLCILKIEILLGLFGLVMGWQLIYEIIAASLLVTMFLAVAGYVSNFLQKVSKYNSKMF